MKIVLFAEVKDGIDPINRKGVLAVMLVHFVYDRPLIVQVSFHIAVVYFEM